MFDDDIEEIRRITNGGYCLENDRFKEEIGLMLSRKVIPGDPGRPRKER